MCENIIKCKDDLCDNGNEFVDSFCCSRCDMARIKLELRYVNERVVYRVTNTGTVNLCNDIFVCSYYFGKIKIDNELLLPNEYAETRQLEYELSQKNENQKYNDYEKEKARAYVRVTDKKFIYSNEVKQGIELGVYLRPSLSYSNSIVYPNSAIVTFIVTNDFNSTMKANNVRVRIPLTNIIQKRLTTYISPYSDVKTEREGNYLYINIGNLEIGEMKGVSIIYDSTQTPNSRELLCWDFNSLTCDTPQLFSLLQVPLDTPIIV